MSETKYTTKEGDTLDQICASYYGYTDGTVEAVLKANPGLAALGDRYAIGVEITLPEIETSRTNSISLFSPSAQATSSSGGTTTSEDLLRHNTSSTAHTDIRAVLATKANASDVAKAIANKGSATDVAMALKNAEEAIALATSADEKTATVKSDVASAVYLSNLANNTSNTAKGIAQTACDTAERAEAYAKSACEAVDVPTYEKVISDIAAEKARAEAAEADLTKVLATKAVASEVTDALALKGSATDVATALAGITTEKNRAEAVEADLSAAIDKKGDATDLQTAQATADEAKSLIHTTENTLSAAIALKADQSALEAEIARAKIAEASAGALSMSVTTEEAVTRTLVLDDANRLIRFTAEDPTTVIIPLDADVPLPIGSTVWVHQAGFGRVTLEGVEGVTLNTSSTLQTLTQHSTLVLTKVGQNEWDIMGEKSLATASNKSWPSCVLAAGDAHSLRIRDGILYATGYNSSGQLGTGDTVNLSEWTPVAPRVTSVAAGSNHSFYISYGVLYATGCNEHGELGTGDKTNRTMWTPVASNVVAVAAGSAHSFYLTADGVLYGVGDNTYGQLGTGNTTACSAWTQVATGVTSIVTAGGSGLYLTGDGVIYATGYNNYGQLGTGDITNRTAWTPVAGRVSKILATGARSCYLTTDSVLYYAGYRNGQFSDDDKIYQYSWSPIPNVTDVVSVIGNFLLTADGELYGMGDNSKGQLGAGDTTTTITKLTKIASDVSRAIMGAFFSIYETTDGTLYATGSNTYGQLGIKDFSDRYTWTAIKPFTGIKKILAMETYTFILLEDGTLYAAGNNSAGQLGTGSDSYCTTLTKIANEVDRVTSITYSNGTISHSFYISTNGDLYATGSNANGQLGTGDTVSRNTWTRVATKVASIIPCSYYNYLYSYYISTDGIMYATGWNNSGHLGTGDTTSPTTWTQVATNVASVTGSYCYSFYISTDRTMYATGNNNYGSLGTGDTLKRTAWTQVATNVNSAVIETYNSYYLSTNGDLYVTGENANGQFGLGDRTSRTVWTLTASNVSSIETSENESFYITKNKLLYVSGYGVALSSTQGAWQLSVASVDKVIAKGTCHYFMRGNDLYAIGSNTSYKFGVGNVSGYSGWTRIATLVSKIIDLGTACAYLNTAGDLFTSGSYSNIVGSTQTSWYQLSTGVTDFEASANSIFAIGAGALRAVGGNSYGQLGVGDKKAKTTLTNIYKH